jgi:hypothetical protein
LKLFAIIFWRLFEVIRKIQMVGDTNRDYEKIITSWRYT